MKKVLIITYYWPPSGGSGVQRWLKFTKYLREFGWEPIIYTVENGEFPIIDTSLEKDVPEGITVLRQPIWEPYQLYKFFTGQKKTDRVVSGFLSENKKPSLSSKISTFIRGNFFIPDARMFWIRPSIRFLKEYLANNTVDAMVSNGPPHSTHLIALGIKEKMNIPWLADFRDPWTAIDFYQDLMLTPFADWRHHTLEKKVITKANTVVVVSETRRKDFEQIVSRKVAVVTNGYDESDVFDNPSALSTKEFSIAHIGLMNKDRNLPVFWRALRELTTENPAFAQQLKVKLIGKCDASVRDTIAENQMEAWTEYIDYMPHKEVSFLQQSVSVLYLPINNVFNAEAVLPGKVFEYLAARRPILVIGPEGGDASVIIREAGAGWISGFEDVEKLKANLSDMFQKHLSQQLHVNPTGISQYSRRSLTGKMAALLTEISEKK